MTRRAPTSITLPVDSLVERPMRPVERSLLISFWWAMRRKGVRLSAEQDVIVIDGGAS